MKIAVTGANGLLGWHTSVAEHARRHPCTAKRLAALGHARHWLVKLAKPFGFFDYNHLQRNAYCAISDGGTIAEEAATLGFGAITPRDATERPEALDVGTIIVTGLDADTILNGVDAITKRQSAPPVPPDYCIENTSERVVNLVLGTALLSNNWGGIRSHDLAP